MEGDMSILQQQVLDYIDGRNTTTLQFWDLDKLWEDNLTNIANSDNLDMLVFKCLELTVTYLSFNIVTKNIETTYNRWRSSLDIWRHVKYFKSDVTIFQVMKSLWNIRKCLVGHYCPDISRRVFKIRLDSYTYTMMKVDRCDEYNLEWEDWKHILEE